MPSDPDHESLDAIIERVTVDAYGDEGHIDLEPGHAWQLLAAYRRWLGLDR